MDTYSNYGKSGKYQLNIYLLIFTLYYIGTMIFDLNEKYLLISQVLFVLMIIFSSWLMVIRSKRISLKPYLFFLCVILATFFITALTGINYQNSVTRLETLLKIFILCVMTYQILSIYISEQYIEKLFIVSGIALFTWVLYVYGINNYFTLILSNTERLGAEVSQENVMGMNAALIASVLLYYVFNKKRYSYLIIVAMMMTVVAASGSKKALFTLPLAIIIILIQKNGLNKLYKTIIGICIFALIGSAIIQLQIFDGLRERINDFVLQLQGTNVDNSTELRSDMIKYGLIWFTEHPILGIGIDNYKYLSVNLFGMYRYAHNNYIELLVGTGIVGFTAFYSMYFYLIKRLFKLRKSDDSIAQIFLLILLIQLFCDIASVSYLYKSTYIYLIMAFVCIDNEAKKKRCHNSVTEFCDE